MLEKPDIPDEVLLAGLRDEFALEAGELTFLPLGADVNTAAYRVEAGDGARYFLKVRQSNFDELSVMVPLFLKRQGVREIIAPLETKTGGGWGSLGDFGRLTLQPFIEGENGFHARMPDRLLIELGEALRAIHSARVPEELKRLLPRETFSAEWRERVRAFQRQVEGSDIFKEPVARRLAAFMRSRREEIARVVQRAEDLARELQRRPLEHVLCHADLHSGNLLITGDETLYIVDWDTSALAPRERDLMFIHGGIGGALDEGQAEGLFYEGYGQVELDRTLLAYYRYERIVQDFAAYCEQLLLTDEGGEDREQGLDYFMSNFLPGNTIARADEAGNR